MKNHIFAETFFNRKRDRPNAPIFALAALESKRYITVKDGDDIPSLIRNHYANCPDGECYIWGIVQEYHYYHNDKCDIYSVEGTFIKSSERKTPSNRAVIKV